MIKRYSRLFIIGTLQMIFPIILLLAIAPIIFKTKNLAQWNYYFTSLHPSFIILHGLFYLSLIVGWPKLINHLQANHPASTETIQTLLKCRWYILTVFLLIDSLMLWRLI